jgi:hypothetical protein
MKSIFKLICILLLAFLGYTIYNDYKPSKAVKELSYEMKDVSKTMNGGWK